MAEVRKNRKARFAATDVGVAGRVPPQDVQLEIAVLGAVMLDNNAIEGVIDFLTPEAFYVDQHMLIWASIVEMYKKSQKIDILTVTQALRQKGDLEKAGGAYYITQLTNRVASSAHIEYHARIVAQHYLKREMIRISSESILDAYQETSDTFDVFQKGISRLEGALSSVLKYEALPAAAINDRLIKNSREIVMSGHSSGVPTGFRNIDNFTNGWQKTDLIIIAGRPAMGKSVVGLSFALNPAIQENIPTAVFTLEMSADQLIGRAQSGITEIDSSRIIKKQFSLEEIDVIERQCAVLNRAPLYIDDTPALGIYEFKAKARRLVRERGVKLIVVDYLQLMRVESDKSSMNREAEVSLISRTLKAVAKELNIPIIALSQLSRSVESRSDKKPQLSDLRESGAIEQDADMVIFCFRPEYYDLQEYEMEGLLLNAQGLMVLIVAKHRAGGIGELRLGFNGRCTKLENYDTYQEKLNGTYNKFPNDEGYGRVMITNPVIEGNAAPNFAVQATLGTADDTPF